MALSRTPRGLSTGGRILVGWAFANTDLIRLEIVCAVGNLRSQRTAERAGAIREGVLRHRLLIHGHAHDAVMYAILRSDRRDDGVLAPP